MTRERKSILPIPTVRSLAGSPKVVRVLDKIRFGPLSQKEECAEFCWFTREYPRVYRHHFDHAEYRIIQVHNAYVAQQDAIAKDLPLRDGVTEVFFSRRRAISGLPNTYELYWNFECFVAAVASALDVAARIAGTAFRTDTPSTFNRFAKTAPQSELGDLFRSGQRRWVHRLKAYRDCFVHFTPVDTLLGIGLYKYRDGWQLRARIPVNPEEREILRFRHSRTADVLSYAATVWRHLWAFDRAFGRILWSSYRAGLYPAKIDRLFYLGRGERRGSIKASEPTEE